MPPGSQAGQVRDSQIEEEEEEDASTPSYGGGIGVFIIARQINNGASTSQTIEEVSSTPSSSVMNMIPNFHTVWKNRGLKETLGMIGIGWPSHQRKTSAWLSDLQDMKKELPTFPVLTSLTLLVR